VLISSITIGDRVRKDMGDLRGLADSITTHGLLHPIVVQTDGRLIAGHRRIEAARLLGWEQISATVIDVTDLLAAERAENEQRKDFTASEAVAIGRLIEGQARPDPLETGKRRWDTRRAHAVGESPTRSERKACVADVAAKAVGMARQKYTQAKAVVAAAEADPTKFGDLVAVMDESRNVAGTHRELERRKSNGASGRHPVHHHSRHRDQTKEMERAIAHIEGAASVFESIDAAALDEGRKAEWISSLGEVRARIGRAIKRLRGERE
jgi:ParB-like chromosome segregation protein Spo0J